MECKRKRITNKQEMVMSRQHNRGDKSYKDIADFVGCRKSTVSRHLKPLLELGGPYCKIKSRNKSITLLEKRDKELADCRREIQSLKDTIQQLTHQQSSPQASSQGSPYAKTAYALEQPPQPRQMHGQQGRVGRNKKESSTPSSSTSAGSPPSILMIRVDYLSRTSPAEHRGFCINCKKQLQYCPMCRADIETAIQEEVDSPIVEDELHDE